MKISGIHFKLRCVLRQRKRAIFQNQVGMKCTAVLSSASEYQSSIFWRSAQHALCPGESWKTQML